MNALRDGFRALAAEAPPGVLPDGFYDTVRGRHRARRAAAAVAVIVVVLLVGVGWAVRPAAPGSSVADGAAGPVPTLPVPPWYTGGSAKIGVTAAIYGGPATVGDWQEGRFAAASADGQRVRVRNGATYTPPGFEALLSPDGTWLAQGRWVTSLVTGRRESSPGTALAFSPDSSRVVYRDDHGGIGVVDFVAGTATGTGIGDAWVVPGTSVAVSAANDRLAVQVGDVVTVYEVRAAQLTALLTVRAAGMLAGPGAFLPDGTAFAMAVRDGTTWHLRMHLVADGSLIGTRTVPATDARYVRVVGWRADGAAVAVTGVPRPGAAPLPLSQTVPWSPYSDLGSARARLVVLPRDGVQEVLLETPVGVGDLDVAAGLAVAGAFRFPADPGYDPWSHPLVWTGIVGGLLLIGIVSAVATYRART